MLSERVSHHLTCQLPGRERSWHDHPGSRIAHNLRTCVNVMKQRGASGARVRRGDYDCSASVLTQIAASREIMSNKSSTRQDVAEAARNCFFPPRRATNGDRSKPSVTMRADSSRA